MATICEITAVAENWLISESLLYSIWCKSSSLVSRGITHLRSNGDLGRVAISSKEEHVVRAMFSLITIPYVDAVLGMVAWHLFSLILVSWPFQQPTRWQPRANDRRCSQHSLVENPPRWDCWRLPFPRFHKYVAWTATYGDNGGSTNSSKVPINLAHE